MSQIFQNIKVGVDEDLKEHLSWLMPDFESYLVLKKSVDARKRHAPHWVYTVEAFGKGEVPTRPTYPIEKVSHSSPPVLIVGAGPAGIFAALRLIERGIIPHVFERGSVAEKRVNKINRYWRYGELDPENNVCFGEGGAGLYSDGKLITRIKSPHIPYVLNRLVKMGAPEEIEYLANPHVGSDKLRRILPKLRNFLIELGVVFHFDSKVVDILFENKQVTGLKTQDGKTHLSPHVVLATGHSADDVFDILKKNDVFMEGKSFAVGLRIEHPQQLINQMQYRQYANHPLLGAATYKITYNQPETKTGVYSFCMCPGGYVLASGTSLNGVVSNGMSNYNRGSAFANAALVVTVDHEKSFGKDLWGGMKFRDKIEADAMNMVIAAGGKKELPVQSVADFLNEKVNEVRKGSSISGQSPAPLHKIFSQQINDCLKEALQSFQDKMPGFVSKDSVFYGVESRTSCPIRVTRDAETLESLSHKGLYPAGEGAGYAGGITSAACDGVRIAEKIVARVSNQTLASLPY
jgi:uncharacterized FAD-dependent dehydrogenase